MTTGRSAWAAPAGTTGVPAMITVEGLRKSYLRGCIQAVADVSFTIARGEIFGLIGPDGAGKTSVLQILSGVLRADAGAVSVGGVDVIDDPEAVKGAIGYMPQGLGLNLYDSLTVEENIEFFRDLRQVPRVAYRDNRDRLLRVTRLAPYLDRPAGKLSGGMRQKLALICTLIHLPDVLLLDEPTTGVDPISRRDFWTIIHTLVAGRGVTVMLTTSYMDEAERCHRVSLMHHGAVIAEGAPDDMTSALAGHVFAVQSDHPDDVLVALRRAPTVRSAAIAGGEVRLLVRDGAAALRRQLDAVGLADARMVDVPATLDEVFVHHLSRGPSPADASRNGALTTTVSESRRPPMPPSHEPAVVAERLTCRFGAFTAVEDVSLALMPGEILGLLGPNGAGKTTLIKMLCGLLRPSAGTASVAGYDVHRARSELRGHIGYVSQRFSLYRDQTVLENLRLSAGLYGLRGARRRQRIDALLASLGLESFADRLPPALPMGLRQRLALACAMLHEPRVLFLDEPTAGVDSVARRHLWDLVHLLAHEQGVGVLVSTHYMDEVSHCDRLGFMHEGRLVGLGRPDELAAYARRLGGPMLAVETPDFSQAFLLIREHAPQAMLYGRRIRWQSRHPEDDISWVREALAAAGIRARVVTEALSMEDTFVSVLEAAGLRRG